MRIAITGATGTIGQSLVPLLTAPDIELLLVGRDPERLSTLFPQEENCSYEALSERGKGFDLLLHLAVVNTDSQSSGATFHAVNVDLTVMVAISAKRAGIPRFVNISSVHALDGQDFSPYAKTKREATKRLASMEGIDVLTIYLP